MEKTEVTWEETWGRLDWMNTPDEELSKQVAELSACGISVNAKDNNGDAPLHHAAYGEKIKTIQILLSAHADVNIRNNRGFTPLHAASLSRNAAAIPMLQAARAEINAESKNGTTPLDLAYMFGRLKAVKNLYDAGGVGTKFVSKEKLDAVMGAYDSLMSLGIDENEIVEHLAKSELDRIKSVKTPKRVAKKDLNTEELDDKEKQYS